ncbi:MAG: MATE family efflux transporter [Caulobacterales bacterium 68-7]|nr:MAG: MATE family efflux transporter [Caulobacterales bacterium 68-7]
MRPDPADAERRTIRQDLVELLKLAGPVALSRLGIMVMGLTDAMVVGRHSAEELGFQAMGWAPTAVVLTTSIGLLMGVQAMTSRAVGAGRRAETGAVLRRGVIYAFWIGLASTALLAALGPLLLHHLHLEPGLAEGAARVLLVFSLSLTPNLIASAGSAWLEGLGRPLPATVVMWIANAANLVFNLWLVPEHGAVGSAYATALARVVLVAGVLGYIANMREARELGVFTPAPKDLPGVREMRQVGYGAGASFFVEVGAFSAMSVIAGWLGGLAVAGWAVVLNVASVVFMVPVGVATATAVLVGRAHGAENPHRIARAGYLGFGVALVFGMLVSAVVWPAARLIAGAYTKDAALIELVAPALTLACLFFAADALQVVAGQALRARADILVPTIMHVASYAVVMTPLAWLLAIPLGLGLNGVVWAVIAASLAAAGMLCLRFWLRSRPAVVGA